MTLTLQRALLALVLLVLVVGLVPAAVLLDRRLIASLEEHARAELRTAPLVLADRFANQAGARMMHAREMSASDALRSALLSGDSVLAVELAARMAEAFPGEEPVVVGPGGESWSGPRVPDTLLEETRAGGMPVVVVSAEQQLGAIALAPVMAEDGWMGATGVWVPLESAEAAQLSVLTRSDVLVSGPDRSLGAYTGRAEPAMGLFGMLAGRPTTDEVEELEWSGERYFVIGAELPGGARVSFVRPRSESLAVVPALRAVGGLAFGLASMLALLVGASFSARLARPVRSLAEAARRVGEGDFGAPVERSRLSEVEEVARSFEQMRDALAARIADLSEANAELEDKQSRLAMLQAELVQRDRHSAAARLLAQLAHEIRNPVASVRNCLEILRRRVADDAEAREFAERAIDELLRMHELAEHMLDLHRPRDRAGACDASEVAREVAALVRIGLGDAAITLEVHAPEAAPTAIPADALKQILLNLVQNALDAIGEGPGRVEVWVGRDGERVRLVVSDDGPGIEPEAHGRLFDPFFTTKADIHGVGLGLFTADGLARTHGGGIRAHSRTEASGAEFVVHLPVAAPERAGAEVLP